MNKNTQLIEKEYKWIPLDEYNFDQKPSRIKFPLGNEVNMYKTPHAIRIMEEIFKWTVNTGLVHKENIPIYYSHNKYLINDEPSHPNDVEFKDPFKYKGMYLHKGYSKGYIIQRAIVLLETLDIDPSSIKIGV